MFQIVCNISFRQKLFNLKPPKLNTTYKQKSSKKKTTILMQFLLKYLKINYIIKYLIVIYIKLEIFFTKKLKKLILKKNCEKFLLILYVYIEIRVYFK